MNLSVGIVRTQHDKHYPLKLELSFHHPDFPDISQKEIGWEE